MRHLHYRPANNFKRTVAYLIDVVPIQMALYVISMSVFDVSPMADPIASTYDRTASLMANSMIGFGTLGIWLLYCIVAELSPMRGTFGKKAMGIAVRSTTGSRMTLGQVLGRNAAKILSALPCYLGFFVAFFTHGNRAWHDSLSKTAVTDRR
ncbi:MAG: RDD family protein [Luteolibacter sp.]